MEQALPAAQPVGLLESAGCEHLREHAAALAGERGVGGWRVVVGGSVWVGGGAGGALPTPWDTAVGVKEAANPGPASMEAGGGANLHARRNTSWACVPGGWPALGAGRRSSASPPPCCPSLPCCCAGMGEAHFAHAMCRACYLDFIQVEPWAGLSCRERCLARCACSCACACSPPSSPRAHPGPPPCQTVAPRPACPLQTTGGVYNGADPPAFERARRKEQEMLALEAPGEGSGGRPGSGQGVWGHPLWLPGLALGCLPVGLGWTRPAPPPLSLSPAYSQPCAGLFSAMR